MFFLLLQKEPKSSRDFVLRPRFKSPVETVFLLKITGLRYVTSYAQIAILHRIDGNDLNRC